MAQSSASKIRTRVRRTLRQLRVQLAKFLDPGPEPDDEWEMAISEPLRAAQALRGHLAIDEPTYLAVAGQAVGDARAYVLYTALDEVIKTSLWLIRMRELLQGDSVDPNRGVIERLLHTHLYEEQSARARRLLEVLVTLINFSGTDEQPYYRHLLALELLENRLSANQDLKEFWHCPSKNIAASMEMQVNLIRSIEPLVDITKCWYLHTDNRPIRDAKQLRIGRLLTSARARIICAFPQMTSNERLLFGFSYGASYSRASEAIHYSPEQVDHRVSAEHDLSARSYLMLLQFAIITRCFALAGKPEIPLVEKHVALLEKLEASTDNHGFHRKTINVGDIVLAYGDPAQVVEIGQSKYGQRAFRVQYLAERPMPELDDDWFPAPYVQLFYTRQQMIDSLREMERAGRLPQGLSETFESLPDEETHALMRQSVGTVWKVGLGAWVRQDQARRAKENREARRRRS